MPSSYSSRTSQHRVFCLSHQADAKYWVSLHLAVIMMRPYRDVLVWLVGIRAPDNNLFVERAIARVIALLAIYDRDQILAARWEERFANRRTNNFPFGISVTYRNLLRTYFTE